MFRPGLTASLVGGLVIVAIGTTVLLADASKSARRKEGDIVKGTTAKSEEELKQQLTPMQFYVTQQCGTEPAFQNEYWNNHQDGIYVDVVSGAPLFSSKDKFDSGTGWPSFTRPIEAAAVQESKDETHGMSRTEVVTKESASHLGHVFDDGPGPAGKRYCINSASLRFIPAAHLEAEGYGKYRILFPELAASTVQSSKTEPAARSEDRATATLAGGCFWGMEEILRKIPGVLETKVGYAGGALPNPSYEQVSTGHTGHAETVQIVFDPGKISYAELLHYFFRMHDPTTLNRQSHDVGSQYRSAIFYQNEEQRRVAEQVLAEVDRSGKWKSKIVTEVVPAKTFYPAEGYHQGYLQKHPDGYSCHYLRD